MIQAGSSSGKVEFLHCGSTNATAHELARSCFGSNIARDEARNKYQWGHIYIFSMTRGSASINHHELVLISEGFALFIGFS
jgi:hypothetical protein